jgi:microcin C transport system substrate-binding protein
MADALDEVSTEYGLLAEAVSHPPDFSAVTYRLRREAKWHDGKPVTVEDVIFTLGAFKKHHPQYAAYYRHVIGRSGQPSARSPSRSKVPATANCRRSSDSST